MSGFAGVACADGALPEELLLQQMARHLAFRGPDATHFCRQPGAGFCFTFLRTGPAPQSQAQPCSLDGHVWLLGDVRLDGRKELRRRLEQVGHSLPSEVTDEELILHAWQKWGEASIGQFQGDFALVLWDSRSRRLLGVRDLIGIRPFFYSYAGERLYFSNTLEALRLSPKVSSALDPHFIGDFLLLGWCPNPERTAFRDIHRLAPGRLLEFSNGELRVRRFATLPVEEPLGLKRPEEYIEQFQILFEEAVRDRLPPYRAAIFMSGGLDSTSVAGHAARMARESEGRPELHAFTIDFRPLFDDEEGLYASRAAKHFGIPIDILSGGDATPFASWQESQIRTPEPCYEPFLASHLELYGHVSSFARVVLSGEGGDDILTGQAWPYLIYLVRRFHIGRLARDFGGYVLKHGRIPPLRAGFRTRFRRWIGRSEPRPEYPRWLEPRFEKEFHLQERWQELQQPPREIHPLHPKAFASLSGTYWASVMEDEDAALTRAPVERRAPMLDLRLIRFLLRIPPVPWCVDKELLRQSVRGLLPEEIRRRRKTPLRADPFALLVKERHWCPPLPPRMIDTMRQYVDAGRLSATLASVAGCSLLNELRPVALYHWLKDVEKGGQIQ